MFKALNVKDDIFWVGALDFDIRTFDVIMHTEYGTTYNAYIIKGSEKTAVVEAVKETFFDEYLERVKNVINPSDIDYLIVDHTEPDHSGAVEKMLEVNPDITVVGTVTAINFLKQITNREFKSLVVKNGDTLDLGGKTLEFNWLPFLHWPDSMYTYLVEDKVLFTCDSFGCHYADEKVFNDLINGDFLDSYKYYFDCIMGPFKEYVVKALDRVKELDIDVICPGHGPVLRKDIKKYVDLYREWSFVEKQNKVVVGFVSAYGYTKKMALKIVEGIKSKGIDAVLFDLETADKGEVMSEIYSAKGLLLGSPTLVNDALPPVWDILTGLNATIHKGLLVGAFGSFGWSGEAVPNMEGRFEQLKFKMPAGSLKINFKPSEDELEKCFEYGAKFAENIK